MEIRIVSEKQTTITFIFISLFVKKIGCLDLELSNRFSTVFDILDDILILIRAVMSLKTCYGKMNAEKKVIQK